MAFVTLVRAQWDRIGGAVLTLAGALIILLGWRGAAQALYPAEQLPYIISGGLFGLFLLGLGSTLWLSADLRDEWRQIRLLEEALMPVLEKAAAQQPMPLTLGHLPDHGEPSFDEGPATTSAPRSRTRQ